MEWLNANRCRLGGTEFVVSAAVEYPSTGERLWLAKNRALLDLYRRLTDELQPKQVVEFGMMHGGSVAYLAELTDATVVGVDIGEKPNTALDDYRQRTGRPAYPYWSTDQADRATVEAILARHFDGPIDLAIDDASHLLEESLVTFNTVFPRVRPGGAYVIEDWGWSHRWAEGEFATAQPLSRLVMEAVMTCASRCDIVAGVRVQQDATVVIRGDADLTDDFDLSTAYEPGPVPVF